VQIIRTLFKMASHARATNMNECFTSIFYYLSKIHAIKNNL